MTAAADPELPAPGVVIGIGASAGGVEALTSLVGRLRVGLRAAVVVVLHVSSSGTSVLAQILDRAGPLRALTAADGDRLREGIVYVAPPDRHVLIEDGTIRLSAGPRENGHRPAVDPTLRSLADYGSRAVGVILSGTRDDGTAGLARLVAAGGTALVQEPAEAAYDGMIRSAMTHVAVDGVHRIADLARRLTDLAQKRGEMPEETHNADHRPATVDRSSTRYTCPECGGHLRREQADTERFVCEVGHAYSPASLDDEQALATESALWTAIRLLGDRASLLDEMAARAGALGHARSAERFRAQAVEAHQAQQAIRRLLEDGRVPTAGALGEVA